jgi:hypothetical protein
MITQADKGKTTVLIDVNEYTKKVQMFLTENNFPILPKGPTDKYQKTLHKTMQHWNLILDKHKINTYFKRNPHHQY